VSKAALVAKEAIFQRFEIFVGEESCQKCHKKISGLNPTK
jgi:hypothetical protein